jgi:DNA ligase-associated metallophosphoesterase
VNHDFHFGGQHFSFAGPRALYWKARRALLVADLHLEKASWFAARGQMLPPYDSRETLTRLLALAEAFDAREIWALGDSFHDDAGPGRLDAETIAQIQRLGRGRRIIWIAGNHDVGASAPGDRVEEAFIDGIVLRHEACTGETRPELSGHYHPKARMRSAGGRQMFRPCAAHGGNRLILPAFGALTGGLDICDPAIRGWLGAEGEAMVWTEKLLLRLKLQESAHCGAKVAQWQ